MSEFNVIVMAGGKGERFWPLSRTQWPKQFLTIAGNRSMLQMTVDRLRKLVPLDKIHVVTNSNYRNLVLLQLPELPEANILLEPVGRDTAACIGLAAYKIAALYPDSELLIVPADHYVEDEREFVRSIEKGRSVLRATRGIVTMGIKPTYPETGYGYMQVSLRDEDRFFSSFKVERFLEKPNRETAEYFIDQPDYFWNSGMFLWHTDTIRDMIGRFLPDLYKGLETIRPALGTKNEQAVLEQVYPRLPAISIDYGVMEKADNIRMVPCDFRWNDVGSWGALEKISQRDMHDNVIQGNVVNLDTYDCIIHSKGNKLIATLGIQDIIIVDTEDITLVCSKYRSQHIKELIKELKRQKMEAYL
ncbi:mannose-1-phosphate guanylyltransferase [Effusibacillus lacus]|uniref:mannose-1-phosphate guanylyltransferase n=1 Tax=Effusibacillus lacus TaxID=1348429 RepID=A0A292YJ61_9BACL|nr:mannose-1-phosphate guanylyltransferase [Effusibacillus lacus]TCS76806.1 mannose-1-phosphate guanylyltransferase [Effusibacillus lacus]GAX91137.1 mannose-1-phosphate guanylyltransferase [Effusibacillus lacus]